MTKKFYTGLILITLIISIFPLINFTSEVVRGTNVGGVYSGYFDILGSPYIVTNNITVPFSGFLDIQPGVEIRFKDNAVLYVGGILYANGTPTQPITFTSNLATPYVGSWRGIFLQYAPIVRMNHCKISYASWGIKFDTVSKAIVNNSEIFKCGNGTEMIGGSFNTIDNCKIYDNWNKAINTTGWGAGHILKNNTIYNNAQGIRLSSTFITNIENNTIKDNAHGIRLRSSRENRIVNNDILNTNITGLDPDMYGKINTGLYLNRSHINEIRNNRIVDTNGPGILLNRSSFNEFENNSVMNSSKVGVDLYANCGLNSFINTTISFVNDSSIRLRSSSVGNSFNLTKITKYNDKFGIAYYSSSYWNEFTQFNYINNIPLKIYYNEQGKNITNGLTNLMLTEPKMTNIGQAVIVDSDNFTIDNAHFSNGKAGLFIYNSMNGTVINSVIDDNEVGITFEYNSTKMKIINSSVSTTGGNNFELADFSNVTVLNTTFDRSKISIGYHSNLSIQWFLHTQVIYITGTGPIKIPGAIVYVYDKYDTLVYQGKTNKDGFARFITCTEEIRNDQVIESFNPYNVTAVKMKYQPGYVVPEVEMDSTKEVIVRLGDNHDPKITGSIKPQSTHNRKPTLSWEAGSDPDNDKLIYWVKIWNENKNNLVIEENSTDKLEYKMTNNLTYGERYRVKINATDQYGGWSNDISGFIDVINRAPSSPAIAIVPLESNKKPSKNEDLTCLITEPSYDPDTNPRDKIRYNFLWYKNGILQTNQSIWNTTEISHTLTSNYTATGETWTCEVTATDGYSLSNPESEWRIIKNSAPNSDSSKFPSILIIPEDGEDDGTINLTKIFSDEDNDQLEFSYKIIGENITIELRPTGSIFVKPSPNWNGEELAMFYADDGEVSAFITVRINITPINDPPEVRILIPLTNTTYNYNNSQGLDFKCSYYDPDIVYGDKINLTWVSNISGVFGHLSELHDVELPVGFHKVELIARDSLGHSDREVIYFEIFDDSKPLPYIAQVELSAPINSQIIDSQSTQLSWKVINLTSSEAESVLYDIYLYASHSSQKKLVNKHLGTSLKVTGLLNNTTYYWTVLPYLNNTQGICISGVWSFNVIYGFNYQFGMELKMTEPELEVFPGKINVYNFTLKNTGNSIDRFIVSIGYLTNQALVDFTTVTPSSINLEAKEEIEILLKFALPEDYISGTDKIIVTVRSMIGSLESNLTRNLTINKTIEDQDDVVEEKIPSNLKDLFLMILFTLIVVMIILILFLYAVFSWLKRHRRSNYPLMEKRTVLQERNLLGLDLDKKEEAKRKAREKGK